MTSFFLLTWAPGLWASRAERLPVESELEFASQGEAALASVALWVLASAERWEPVPFAVEDLVQTGLRAAIERPAAPDFAKPKKSPATIARRTLRP